MKLGFKPKHIVILTGAGISAESGIKTFRDNNGLWEDHDIFDVASPMGFKRDPSLVYKFYNQRRKQLQEKEVQPNLAHLALAKLQEKFSGEVCLITQNVDDLHERAGYKNPIHMHGELLKARCQRTKKVYDWKVELGSDNKCDCCQINELRPHIVWFGETPLQMDEIYRQLERCDLFISIGTSGLVYPAAQFAKEAKSHGAHTIELNITQTDISDDFDMHFKGSATQIVSMVVDNILAL